MRLRDLFQNELIFIIYFRNYFYVTKKKGFFAKRFIEINKFEIVYRILKIKYSENIEFKYLDGDYLELHILTKY